MHLSGAILIHPFKEVTGMQQLSYSVNADKKLPRDKKRNIVGGLLDEGSALLFILPFLSVFALFYFWPVLRGVWISLHSWGIAGMQKYVGFKNYIGVLKNPDFYFYIWNSFYFVLLSTPVIIVLGLILALIINEKIIARTAIRAVYFLPYVLSVSIVSYIWMRMLDANNGLVNAVMGVVGLPKNVAWLTDTRFAWWSIVLTTAWWTVGFVMVIYLAGLQEIPEEYYEAADMDGANPMQKLLHIVLPSLSRVTRVQVFFQVIAGLKLFGQVHIMTQGGPGDTTNTLIRYIYVTGFKKDFFGDAAAQSVLFILLMLVISVAQYKFVNKED